MNYTGKKNSFLRKIFLSTKRRHKEKRKKIQCDFCNKTGHNEDYCRFKLKAKKELRQSYKQKTQQTSKTKNSQENFVMELCFEKRSKY